MPVKPPVGFTPPTPAGNPNLQAQCGLNVILVLDASGSVKSANAEDEVQAATRGFINALNGTGSKLAIIDFGSEAEIKKQYVEVNDSTDDALLALRQLVQIADVAGGPEHELGRRRSSRRSGSWTRSSRRRPISSSS